MQKNCERIGKNQSKYFIFPIGGLSINNDMAGTPYIKKQQTFTIKTHKTRPNVESSNERFESNTPLLCSLELTVYSLLIKFWMAHLIGIIN